MKRFAKVFIAFLLLTTACATRVTKYEANPNLPVDGQINGHDYVDLGLPSHTLWATCNVGATKPEEYGGYYAWGETVPKIVYSWENYKYANGVYDKLKKYCFRSDYGSNGYTDQKNVLEKDDDPASSWGSRWCSPSKMQWDELLQNTTYSWTDRKGVGGMLFVGKNGQTLFLPAAGLYYNEEYNFSGRGGYYWSSSLGHNPSEAWHFSFNSGDYHAVGNIIRSNGFSIRPVHGAN